MESMVTWLKDISNWLPPEVIAGRIRRKQLAAMLVIALVPLAALGLVSYRVATDTLMHQAAEQLDGIRQLKKNMVQNYFSERRTDLEQLVNTLSQVYALGADEIRAANPKKANPSESDLGMAMKNVVAPSLEGSDDDMIKHYRKLFGFENIYLIGTSGYVFHSANHGPDRYTNLLTGPYRDTNLGRLAAKVLRTESFGMTDFDLYIPAQHAPAAFMAQPVMHDGKVVFVVAVQLPIGQISAIAAERTGLGQTGEIYFVGKDKMLRNDVYRLKKQKVSTSMLSQAYKVDTTATRGAMKGNTDTKPIKNFQGIPVLSSWQPLTIVEPNPVNPEGIRWALITEIDQSEVRGPLITFGLIMAGALGVAVVLVVVGAYILSGGLTRQIRHIMDLFSEIGMGNFRARCKVVSRDELGRMARSLNAMLDNTTHLIQSIDERDSMQQAIMKLLTDISALTEGDLTIRAEVTEDMTGAIADSFNTMTEQLSHLVSDVKKSTHEVSQISRQVSETTIDLSRTSDEHAARINDAVKSIDEMSTSIQLVSKHAETSARVSEQAKKNAVSGADAVRQTNQAMSAIRERVQETARAIKRLGESSQEIGNIVQIINDISDRTSILALNASIQAAMAGDAGRGFAVVAEEVQRLAEQSGNSAKQIETLIKTIQSEINEAGTRMDDSIQRVVQGTELANGAHNKLEAIEEVSSDLAELVKAISMAAKEQAASSVKISTTMKEVGRISSQTALQGKQTADSIINLAQTSGKLHASVEVFKILEEALEADDDLEILMPLDTIDEDDEALEVLLPVDANDENEEDLEILCEVG